ncbi:MAG: transcriptional regulator Spx [Alkalibacterium sp.]|nr:transcriptional regulator Spx [Alkalibacterium sp.]
MITLYVSPSCTSCRKAKAWLEEQNLPFTEKNIFHEPLTKKNKQNLSLTEEGTTELDFYRSQAYQCLTVDIEDFSMNELLELFTDQPSLIRRPIIMDDRRLQIGYNEEEIRCFLPRKVREIELAEIHRQLAVEDSA